MNSIGIVGGSSKGSGADGGGSAGGGAAETSIAERSGTFGCLRGRDVRARCVNAYLRYARAASSSAILANRIQPGERRTEIRFDERLVVPGQVQFRVYKIDDRLFPREDVGLGRGLLTLRRFGEFRARGRHVDFFEGERVVHQHRDAV